MARQSNHQSLQLLSVGLSLNLFMFAGLATKGQAQSTPVAPGQSISDYSIVSVTFEPQGNRRPRDTAGGASRDGGGVCPQDTATTLNPAITPLEPGIHNGLTISERPTFFVYIPETSAQKAFFVLKDQKEDYYYQTSISMPQKAGIVSIKLPAEAPALEVGKNYQWSLVMMCGEAVRPDSPGVGGQIQRIAANPSLNNQLEQLSPVERAAFYGKNGIWYDTIASMAEQRRLHPQDSTLTSTWEKLLRSVGLDAIAAKPLLPQP